MATGGDVQCVADSASKSHHVVKDAVCGINSVNVVNESYMERNFPGWRDQGGPRGGQTFVMPPRFEYSDWYMPEQGANIPVRPRTDTEIKTLHGKLAEEKVVRMFAKYGEDHKQPMFIFHNFDFKVLKKLIERNGEENLLVNKLNVDKEEKDIIIVHRDIGIILVETKGMETYHKKTYKLAKDQLVDAVDKLKILCPKWIDEELLKRGAIKKVIACPNLEEKVPRRGNDYIDLRKYDLNDFENWWHTTITKGRVPDHCDSTCKSIYLDLVPKLLFGRGDICICLNIKLADQIGQQMSQERLHERDQMLNKKEQKKFKEKANYDKIPTVDQLEQEDRPSKIAKIQSSFRGEVKWLYLTPEQCGAWKKRKQVICGTYGCGKTVLLQCKAMTLARSEHAVLVIVPLHLKPVYKKFFTDTLQTNEIKNIELLSVEDFYNSFDEYKVLAEASHVFVDELLWRYVDSNGGSSISSYKKTSGETNLRYYGNTRGDYASKRGVEFINLLYTLFTDSSNQKHVWIVPNLFNILPAYFVSRALSDEASHFDVLFQYEVSNFTGLTTVMRTCKEIHEYIKKNESKDFSRPKNEDYYINNGFFNTDIYGILFCSKLGHSISAKPILGSNVQIFDYPGIPDEFPAYCVRKIQREINKLLKEGEFVTITCEGVRPIKRNKAFRPTDLVIIASMTKKIDLEEIMKSVNQLQQSNEDLEVVHWKLCTIQKYHENPSETEIPICYSKDVASLEWPVVIHIRYLKTGAGGFTIQDSLGEDNVVVSRCILYYILICLKDDYRFF